MIPQLLAPPIANSPSPKPLYILPPNSPLPIYTPNQTPPPPLQDAISTLIDKEEEDPLTLVNTNTPELTEVVQVTEVVEEDTTLPCPRM
jgi:hypothetical protein